MQNLYRHFDDAGALLYIGVSLNSINRLSQHQNGSHWFEKIARVEIEQFDSRPAALEAETNAIASEQPLHNIQKRAPLPKLEAEKAKTDVLRQVVFHPTYTVTAAANVLNLGPTAVKRLIDSGQLGCINIPNGQYVKKLITGWQVIDFIENKERV